MSSLISLSFTFYHNSEFSNANTHTNTYLLYTQLNISQVFTECDRQEFALLFFIRFLVHTVGFHHSRSLTLYHTLSLSSHSIPPFSKWCHSFVYWRVNLLQISLHCEQFPAYSWYIVWLKTRNNNPNKEDVSGYVIVKHWMQKSGRNGGRQFERQKTHPHTHHGMYRMYKGQNEKCCETCEMNLFSPHSSFYILYGNFTVASYSNEDTLYVTFYANGRNLVYGLAQTWRSFLFRMMIAWKRDVKSLRQRANIKGINRANKVKSNWKKARKIKTYEFKIK